MRIGRKKSPLKDVGGNQGHAIMTKEAHINAHGGDVMAAGYEVDLSEEESKSPWSFTIPKKETSEEEYYPWGTKKGSVGTRFAPFDKDKDKDKEIPWQERATVLELEREEVEQGDPLGFDESGLLISGGTSGERENYFESFDYTNRFPLLQKVLDEIDTHSDSDNIKDKRKKKIIRMYKAKIASGDKDWSIWEEYEMGGFDLFISKNDPFSHGKMQASENSALSSSFLENKFVKKNTQLSIIDYNSLSLQDQDFFNNAIGSTGGLNHIIPFQADKDGGEMNIRIINGKPTVTKEEAAAYYGVNIKDLDYYEFVYDENDKDFKLKEKLAASNKEGGWSKELELDFSKDKKVQKIFSDFIGKLEETTLLKGEELKERYENAATEEEKQKIIIEYEKLFGKFNEKGELIEYGSIHLEGFKKEDELKALFASRPKYAGTLADYDGVMLPEPLFTGHKKGEVYRNGTNYKGTDITFDELFEHRGGLTISENDIEESVQSWIDKNKLAGWTVEVSGGYAPGVDAVTVKRRDGRMFHILPYTTSNYWLQTMKDMDLYSGTGEQRNKNIWSAFVKWAAAPTRDDENRIADITGLGREDYLILHKKDESPNKHTDGSFGMSPGTTEWERAIYEEKNDNDGAILTETLNSFGGLKLENTDGANDKGQVDIETMREFSNLVTKVYKEVYLNPELFKDEYEYIHLLQSEYDISRLGKDKTAYSEEDLKMINAIVWEEVQKRGDHIISIDEWNKLMNVGNEVGDGMQKKMIDKISAGVLDEQESEFNAAGGSEGISDATRTFHHGPMIDKLTDDENKRRGLINQSEVIISEMNALNKSIASYGDGTEEVGLNLPLYNPDKVKEVETKLEKLQVKLDGVKVEIKALDAILEEKGTGYKPNSGIFNDKGYTKEKEEDMEKNLKSAYGSYDFILAARMQQNPNVLTEIDAMHEYDDFLIFQNQEKDEFAKTEMITFDLSSRINEDGSLDTEWLFSGRKGAEKRDRAMKIFKKFEGRIGENGVFGELELSIAELNSIWDIRHWEGPIAGEFAYTTKKKFTAWDVDPGWANFWETDFGISDEDLHTWKQWQIGKDNNELARIVSFERLLHKDVANVDRGSKFSQGWNATIRATGEMFGLRPKKADELAAGNLWHTDVDQVLPDMTNTYLLDGFLPYQATYNDYHSDEINKGEIPELKFNEEQMKALTRTNGDQIAEGVGAFVPLAAELAAVSYVTGGALTITRAGNFMKAWRLGHSLQKTKKGWEVVKSTTTAANNWNKMKFHIAAAAKMEAEMRMVGFGPTSGLSFYSTGVGINALPVPTLLKKFNSVLPFSAKPFGELAKTAVSGAVAMEVSELAHVGFEKIGESTLGEVSWGVELDKLYGDSDEVWNRLYINAATFGIFHTMQPGGTIHSTFQKGGKYKWYSDAQVNKAYENLKDLNKEIEIEAEGQKWVKNKDGSASLVNAEGKVLETHTKEQMLEQLSQEMVKGLDGGYTFKKPKNWDSYTLKQKRDYEARVETGTNLLQMKNSRNYHDKLNTDNYDFKNTENNYIDSKGKRRNKEVDRFEKNYKELVFDGWLEVMREGDMHGKDYNCTMEFFIATPGSNVAKERRKAGFRDPDSAAEFIPDLNGPGGRIILDIGKWTPGKVQHEITHATLHASWFKEAKERGVHIDVVRAEFGEKFLEEFGKMDLELMKGTPLEPFIEAQYGPGKIKGAEWTKMVEENLKKKGYKTTDVIPKEARKNAEKEVQEYIDNFWEKDVGKQLKAEEALAYMFEIMAKPEMYYQKTAPTFWKNAKMELYDYIQERGGRQPKIRTTLDMMDLMSRLGKSMGKGESSRSKIKAFAGNIAEIYHKGRSGEIKETVSLDMDPIEALVQHGKNKSSKDLREKKSRDKKVLESGKTVKEQSDITQVYYNENIKGITDPLELEIAIDKMIAPVEGSTTSVAGKHFDGIIYNLVKMYPELAKNKDARFELAYELVTDMHGKGSRGLENLIKKYRPSEGQNLTQMVMKHLEKRIHQMVINLQEKGGTVVQSEQQKKFGEHAKDISEMADVLVDKPTIDFEFKTLGTEVGPKRKGVNLTKKLDIHKVNVDKIESKGKEIILNTKLKDLTYSRIGKGSLKVVRPIIESKFEFSKSIKDGLTNMYLRNANVKDINSLSNKQKGELNKMLLEGPKRYIKKEGEMLVNNALPNQINLSNAQTPGVMKTWGKSGFYTFKERYTYAEMKEINKAHDMGWTESYMGSGPSKFVKKEKITLEELENFLYKTPAGKDLRFEQIETRIESLIDFTTKSTAVQTTKDLLNNKGLQNLLKARDPKKLTTLQMENVLGQVSQRIKGSLPKSMSSKATEVVDRFEQEFRDRILKTRYEPGVTVRNIIDDMFAGNKEYRDAIPKKGRNFIYRSFGKDFLLDKGAQDVMMQHGKAERVLGIMKGAVVKIKSFENWKDPQGGINKTIMDLLKSVRGPNGERLDLSRLNIDKTMNSKLNDYDHINQYYNNFLPELFKIIPKELHTKVAQTLLLDGQYKLGINARKVKVNGKEIELSGEDRITADFRKRFLEGVEGSDKKFEIEIDGEMVDHVMVDGKRVDAINLVNLVDNGTLKKNLLGWWMGKDGNGNPVKKFKKGGGIYDLPQFKNKLKSGIPEKVKEFADHVKDTELKSKDAETYKQTVDANEALLDMFMDGLFEYYKKSPDKIQAINNIQFLLEAQTNIGAGVIRGTATHAAVTIKKELLHSEHPLQVVNFTGNFMENMIRNVDSKPIFKENFNEIKRTYKQAIIPEELRKIIDSPEWGGRTAQLLAEKGFTLDVAVEANFLLDRATMSTIVDLRTGRTWLDLLTFTNEAVGVIEGLPKVRERLAKKYDAVFGTKSNSSKDLTSAEMLNNMSNYDKAVELGRKRKKKRKGGSFWDFDDTLAITKSGVRATIPNPSGKPKPSRKVVFLAGGAGSGKGNVVKKLGLEKDGFKIVNQDISLEWLKKNHGLPENMNDLTKEQRSTLGKLGHQARTIAKGKMMKYQGNAEGVVVDGTGASAKAMEKLVKEFTDKGYDVSMLFVETSLKTALERNRARKERSLLDKIVERNHESVQANKPGFKTMFGERFMEVKTDNLKQEDAMPTDLVSKMNDFVSGYEKVRLDAEQFASEGKNILDKGGEFDFTEFNVITKGEAGPMFQTALNRAKKFGTKDTYILTARPPEAQIAIYEFLKSQGLEIPLENIKCLGNSMAEAKAAWMLEKFAEGYNDMYFADDAIQNVEAVRDVLGKTGVKSKVIQAKSINEVKDVNRLDSPDVFDGIRSSKDLRSEYEKTITKRRPDLVKEGLVSKTVDDMFKFIDELNVPINKKKKYEQITTKWIATSNIKLKEDGYKIKEAVDIAERYKEDIFSYKNPNELIEKYAGKIKANPTNPKTVKEFSKGKITNKEHGIVEYEVANTKEGQQAVRKVMDTHFGEKSNPWCLAQKKDGKLTKESWDRWEHYSDGPKSLVFKDGKLIGFKANEQYWDRMDNATDAPVIRIKEGRVTKTVELVPMGKGKVEEFVMETRTTSKDKKTVTTEYNVERSLDPTGFNFHPAGTKIVENKVNGITVRETNYKPNGNTRSVTEFKSGKEIESRSFMPDGKTTMSINRRLNKNQKLKHGDFVSHEARDGKVDLWFGETLINGKVTEIGFKTPRDFEVMDVMKRVDGKLRVDLNKLRKIDPDIKGLPKEIVKPEGMRTLEPVKKVLDQLDMKSDVQQSRASKDLSKDFNDILEEVKDVKSFKTYSEGKAKQIGAKKGIWKWWGSSGMEDFQGLITYAFAGKGKKGEGHKKFFEDNLQKPYNRAYNEIHSIKQTMSNDYTALRRAMPGVRKTLNKKIDGIYTVDNAIRAYLWNKAGYEVPGMSKRDLKVLVDFVNKKGNEDVKAFAESVSAITKLKEGYVEPKDYWLGENITADLQKLADGHYRDIALQEFKENRESIFGKWKGGKLTGDNMNKIEAIYGTKHRENIEGMLWAMETGQNRPYGTDAITNKWMNWINNAGGTIMFFNVKSAALQTISNLNYMNGTFNNPLRAGMAFANLPQYIKDFSKIFNSDMLLQRRSGLKINIEASELTDRLKGRSNKAQRTLSYLLEKGFIPTKYADSFAIAMGGATYYRNRIKDLIKRGYSKAEAEKLAWIDFTEITEATQQSSRPDFISAQQRSAVGRPILMFGNTPMQMFRRHKRRIQDIANNRGNMTENILSAAYYGAVQTMIFSYLANAMFAKDEDDLEKEESGFNEKKDARFYETIIDSYLRGMGIMGAVPAALKNGILEFMTQNEKDRNADYNEVIFDLLNVSPPIGSKVKKLVSSGKAWKFNKDEIKEMGFDIDNPIIGATANVISALTNVPLDRVVLKLQNLRDASNNDYKTWERIALGTGVNRWALGLGKQEAVIEAETKVKEKKKIETEIKREEKKKIKLKEKYPNKTDEEIEIIIKSKELFDLSKQEQVNLLKSLDLSDKEIKKLSKEKDRTDKIAELYKDNSKLIDDALETSKTKPKEKKVKKKEVKLSKSEKYKKSLFKMKKKDQVNLLLEYGMSPRGISQLKYEKDRVEMIIKLESKKSK